ncbi:hypothetical protein [Corynebacterium accolens]|jgi:hypothetical protein|uniref:hypothetical protein n=1 Tax=Corynebacterium accolens TaxID=38284 RepID=UPI002543ABB4|nr:hypothetical protein [Corynebacterium accolens]MDK4322785.1 hypothetical protein [Corynebacterium accolens]WKS65313.1 hypothetical protein NLL51_03515 [Corynebacterium accolens]
MTDSSLGVRLAKEEDRDYLASLFPSYIADWSPIVDGGVIALPLAANEDPTVEPVGAALLRYYPAATKGPAFLGDSGADPLDDATWLTPFDPEDIPELIVATNGTDDEASRAHDLLVANAIDLAAEQTAPGIASATPLPGFEELAPDKFFRRF